MGENLSLAIKIIGIQNKKKGHTKLKQFIYEFPIKNTHNIREYI